MIVALIPVKSLDTGKSRLRALLPDEAIPQLSLAMLEDVVEALRNVSEIDSIAVVTPDKNVGNAATGMGAQALVRHDPGLNASIAVAAQDLNDAHVRSQPDEPLNLLVIMGDLPGASSEGIQSLIEAAEDLGNNAAVIAPSSDGGTTILLRKPWDAMSTAYGPDSATAHLDLAKEAGLPVTLFQHPELAIDLDEPEDLYGFLQREGAGKKTRALLQQLLPDAETSAQKAEAS
jgi:2-phospho-L-lactate guanylyltransferase